MERKFILKRLNRECKAQRQIIGVAVGAGITAKYAVRGGADMIFVLSSGKFRQMGVGSLAAYLPFVNSNEMVMEIGLREIKPLVKEIPVIFGLNATDPLIDLEWYVDRIAKAGFNGINNYPTIGLVDGTYRQILEENEISFDREVEAIRIASKKGLFTVAFVFDEVQTKQMLNAGADVICVHLGLTSGGILGAKKVLSLVNAAKRINDLFAVCDQSERTVFKMIYGGPIQTPLDLSYMHQHTEMDGYIGGSTFERIQSEKVITNITHAFKELDLIESEDLMAKMLDGITKHYEYVDFIKKYIAEHYQHPVSLAEIAEIAHVSPSHLSRLFKKEVGINFRTYLMEYRMHQATKVFREKPFKCAEVAKLVGYEDYFQFSKIFKKVIGMSPREYQRHLKTSEAHKR